MKISNVGLFLSILVFAAVGTLKGHAQEKFIDKNGVVVFEASEELFEEVKAKNESVTTIFDADTNQIASLALIKGFRFKNSLMQEHFNENYIESDIYPKATFRGELKDFEFDNLNENAKQVEIQGILEVRGKQKEISTQAVIQKIGDVISITGSFIVTPGDFDIHIPKIVRNKIAKEVLVKIDFKLTKKQ